MLSAQHEELPQYSMPHADAVFGQPAQWTNHALMSQQKAMKPRTKTRQSKKVALVQILITFSQHFICYTVITTSNHVKMENHTWHVRQDRAVAELLIIMAGPPTKYFQQSPHHLTLDVL